MKGQGQTQDGARERVAMVIQGDSLEVRMMIRALVTSGSKVMAITKSLDPPMEAFLRDQKRVTIKVVDTSSRIALARAIRGADRAVLETKYWQKFADSEEEELAMRLLAACNYASVDNVLFNTMEDTKVLREKGKKSQIKADSKGRVRPNFSGMKNARRRAKDLGLHLNHMITSYVDTKNSKTSLCLISGENGKLISVPFFDDSPPVFVNPRDNDGEDSSMSSQSSDGSVPRASQAIRRSGKKMVDPLPLTGMPVLLTAFAIVGVSMILYYHPDIQTLF